MRYVRKERKEKRKDHISSILLFIGSIEERLI
nr:MAG TPA: hypothetical protein [Caudoviricetes sp.]